MLPKSTIKQDPLLEYYNRCSGNDRLEEVTEKSLVSPSEGNGFVTCCRLEDGFCAGHYDMLFFEDTTYSYPQPAMNNGGSLYRVSFSLSYESGSGDFYAPHYLTNNRANANAINYGRLGFLPKNKNYQSVEFIFSREWVKKNYPFSSAKIFAFFQFLAVQKDPAILLDMLDQSTFERANIIAMNMEQKHIELLQVKAKIYPFVDLFFQKTTERNQPNQKKGKARQNALIREVEKSLANYYSEELPSIPELASMFNISPSRLKRQFKLMYHKNIYSYYLEQKMTIGFAMLEENKASVSEIAYSLGYQKVNSFSKIFKKHYGILPSEVQSS